MVMIDTAFVRRAAASAVRQYFRPLVAAFESSEPTKTLATEGTVMIPKSPRVQIKGYAIRKRRR
jgi:ribosomal protein S17E